MAPAGMQVLGSITPEYAQILTGNALISLANLPRGSNARRIELLARRARRQKEIDAGKLPDFLAETKAIRDAGWEVAAVPQDLQDRRVEITGPTDRKMVINALNSGANMFMADFEDSSTPAWDNELQVQINMRDAVAGTISFTSPEGKQYKLAEKPATLLVRPRGWHLNEKHIVIDGQPMSGSLFDFGLYFFHNAKVRVKKKSGIYLYLPKMESHLEARLWNEVFVFAQNELDVPQGTVKATVLIETILASFEMEEILFELREHSAGLNCGRWDYIFSCIKKFRTRKDFILADRGLVTMTSPFMRAYSLLLIKTCHKRGAFAMGGMTAEISRAQIWHWIRSPHGVLDDGRKVSKELFRTLVPQELAKVREILGDKGYAAGKYEEGANMFEELTLAEEFVEFLTLPAYEYVTAHEHR